MKPPLFAKLFDQGVPSVL